MTAKEKVVELQAKLDQQNVKLDEQNEAAEKLKQLVSQIKAESAAKDEIIRLAKKPAADADMAKAIKAAVDKALADKADAERALAIKAAADKAIRLMADEAALIGGRSAPERAQSGASRHRIVERDTALRAVGVWGVGRWRSLVPAVAWFRIRWAGPRASESIKDQPDNHNEQHDQNAHEPGHPDVALHPRRPEEGRAHHES